MQEIDLLTATKEDLTFTAPFNLVATRDDCECNRAKYNYSIHARYFRCSCIPCLVRHRLRLHTQESQVFDWPSCAIHALEVCLPPNFLLFFFGIYFF